MVSYKSVFKAIFRSEHTDDSAVAPASSKSRQTPSRAFTVPASPSRPKTLTKPQPVAGPSSRKLLEPYTNNTNRHSAIALRDILSPRPRLRKNSLPSQFPEELPVPPPRVSNPPVLIVDETYPHSQRRLSASPVPEVCQSHENDIYESYSSLDIGYLNSPNGDSKLCCDQIDVPIFNSGLRESSNISLLLSPEPEDARKAMSKRLEGLTMALDMFQPMQTTSLLTRPQHPGFTPRGLTKLDTSLNVTNPLIPFPVSPMSAAAFGSTSLSPIENWMDEEGEEQSSDDDEEFSYFHVPGSKFSGSSHSSSSVSSSTSDLPPTPVDPPSHSTDAVQLLPPFLPKSPTAFNLGPVVQSRVDNCKATPTPVVSADALDAQSGIVLV